MPESCASALKQPRNIAFQLIARSPTNNNRCHHEKIRRNIFKQHRPKNKMARDCCLRMSHSICKLGWITVVHITL